MKLKCYECCAWDRVEARSCVISSCALWTWNRKTWGKISAAKDDPDDDLNGDLEDEDLFPDNSE